MALKTPKHETIISSILLVILAALCIAIVAGTFGANSDGPATRPALRQAIHYKLPAGWKLQGEWETYPNGKLYEKIDGRETLFYDYGCNRLEFASAEFDNQTFDVYLYHMNDADGALGVYLAQTPPEFTELGIAPMSDLAGGQVRAVQNRVYLEVMPQEQKADSRLTQDLAKSILAGAPKDKASATNITELLPAEGRVRGTLAFNKENAFGLKSLANTFSASYQREGLAFDFLVRKIKSADVEKVFDQAANEMKEFDGQVVDRASGRLRGLIMGKTLVLTFSKEYLLGLYGELTEPQVQKAAALMKLDMKENANGKP